MTSLRPPLFALLAFGLWACAGQAFAQTLPLLTIRSFSWEERSEGSNRMPVTLSLDVASSTEVRGRITVDAGTADSPFSQATPGASCVPGVDFVRILNREFKIPAGLTSIDLEGGVEICGDTVLEQNENIVISVSSSTLVGARCPNTADACRSVATIVNNALNSPFPVVRIDNVSVLEPASGTADAVLTVRLARSSSIETTVGYRTQSDTAVSGFPNYIFPTNSCVGADELTGQTIFRDFLPAQGSVVIPARQDRVQIRVPICADGRSFAEPNQRFFVVLTSASSNTGGLADGRGEVTIVANGPPAVGTFQISPDRARVPVDQKQLYQVIWTVPEGKVWRDLSTIALRIRDDERTALWVVWSEIDDSFKLCRRPRGQGQTGPDGDDEPDEAAHLSGIPHNGCSPGALAGSPTVLETNSARLHMATTRAVGSGPAGRTVTLSLGISFKPRAIGQQLIELAASDDFGAADPFTRATAVRVLRKDGAP